MGKRKGLGHRIKNMSLKIKLPFMISVLVVLVLLGATTTSYMISSDVVVRKSKDEINVMADRLGEGLWTAMQLQQQLSHAISVHNTFKELLELRNTTDMTDEEFFSDENPYFNKANTILTDSISETEGSKPDLFVFDKEGTMVAGTMPEVIGQSRGDREYFQESIQGNPSSVTRSSLRLARSSLLYSRSLSSMNRGISWVCLLCRWTAAFSWGNWETLKSMPKAELKC
ncbi:hypothetical protein MT997_05395 [Paenibacillus sp. OVF10]|nr:hypothetical protein MT997_05395 [Paenibacillus sp. OVF10]